MKFARSLFVLIISFVLMAGVMPIAAQDAEIPVTILPVNHAAFLPGALFDVRIELEADAVPENFEVTVNGDAASEVFGAESEVEAFDAGSEDAPVAMQAVTWRDVVAPAPGEYTISVTAGGTTETVVWDVRAPQTGTAKNVILFIADGMTTPEISAARLALGMTEGLPNNPLNVDSFDYIGRASTSSIDSPMMDSANTASAINTGHIGSINATGTYSDLTPDALDDPRVETFAEMIKRLRGMSVGVVSTADFSDATPAAVWAHGRNRSDDSRNNYLVQILEDGDVDVLMGGGSRRMLPQSTEGSRRTDDVDLFADFEGAGYTIVTTGTELTAAVEGDTLPEKLVGVFNPSDMNVWLDRNVYTDNVGDFTDQPGLQDMTMAALEILNQNENGFFLEVEAASVDKQMHPLDQERALTELIEFDKTIGATIEWVQANAPDTLIVVTADHGHGYEVYGTVNFADFDAATDDAGKRNAIGTYNAAAYPDYELDENGFPIWDSATIGLAGVVNNHPDYTEDFRVSPVPRVPAIADGDTGNYIDNPDDDPNGLVMSGNLPLSSSTGVHTLQDVPVFAMGPGQEMLMGSYHQREIFFALAAAIGLDPSAEDGMAQ
jgi:alkaline phosphatase